MAHHVNERIDAIKARLAAATPGPWEILRDGETTSIAMRTTTHVYPVVKAACADYPGRWSSNESAELWIEDADAALISNAPDDLAFLLSEIERLQREAQR